MHVNVASKVAWIFFTDDLFPHMKKFSRESPRLPQELQQETEAESENDKNLLIITFKERQLFEEAGGKYRGLVDTSDGRKFEEFWVGRRAYYDREERKILETYVETTASDGEESELDGPEEVRGFEVLMVKRDSFLHEVGEPLVIDIYPRNFPASRITVKQLREHAVHVHDLVLRNAEANLADLARKVEAVLQESGWRGEAY